MHKFGFVFLIVLSIAMQTRTNSLHSEKFHEVGSIGRGRPTSIGWSSDGATLAVGNSKSEVWFYNSKLQDVGHVTIEGQVDVSKLKWDTDKIIAVVEHEDTIVIRELDSGKIIRMLSIPEGRLNFPTLSPDGSLLAAVGVDKALIYLWSLETGEIIVTLAGGERRFGDVAWSPDGSQLASKDVDKSIYIWDTITGNLLARKDNYPEKQALIIAWSSDGSKFVVTRNDESNPSIEIWNAQTYEIIQVLDGHPALLYSLAWTLDGSHMIGGGNDSSIYIWNIASGNIEMVFAGSRGTVIELRINPENGHLVSLKTDATIELWNVEAGVREAVLYAHDDGIVSIAWSPDGKRLATGGHDDDPRIRIWDVQTGAFLVVLEGHTKSVNSLTWHGNYLASAGSDGMIHIWDTTSYNLFESWSEVDEAALYIRDIAWSPNGALLAASSSAGIQVRDFETGQIIKRWDMPSQDIAALDWNLDGTQFVRVADGNIKIFDIGKEMPILEIENPVYRAFENDVAWSPQSNIILVSGSGVVALDSSTGEILSQFEGSEAAWSPNGGEIATVVVHQPTTERVEDLTSDILILDAETLEIIEILSTDLYASTDKLEWNHDGTQLAVANEMGSSVQIWKR